MASKAPTRIGVLLLDTVQLLDLSPIDLFAMLDPTYLSVPAVPASLKAGAVPMEIIYIGNNNNNNRASGGGGKTNAFQECTANAALCVDATVADEVCAPPPITTKNGGGGGKGKGEKKTLDILLIPGPDPWAYEASGAVDGFIRGHFESGTDVLTVCTGAYPAAYAGIFNGRKVTGPRALVPDLKKKFPEAKWEEKRWVSDGNLWSGAGVTNGQDMVAAYIRNKWPGPTAEAVLAMADVGDRPQEYGSSKASNNAWWLLQIVRAWMFPYKN